MAPAEGTDMRGKAGSREEIFWTGWQRDNRISEMKVSPSGKKIGMGKGALASCFADTKWILRKKSEFLKQNEINSWTRLFPSSHPDFFCTFFILSTRSVCFYPRFKELLISQPCFLWSLERSLSPFNAPFVLTSSLFPFRSFYCALPRSCQSDIFFIFPFFASPLSMLLLFPSSFRSILFSLSFLIYVLFLSVSLPTESFPIFCPWTSSGVCFDSKLISFLYEALFALLAAYSQVSFFSPLS